MHNTSWPPPIMEALSQNDPPPPSKSQWLSAKGFHLFWFLLPYIHPAVPFVKGKLPVVFILPPAAVAPSQDKKPVSVSMCLVIVHKAVFSNSSNAFRTQGWFDLARDDVLRLHRTLPLVSYFWVVGWLIDCCQRVASRSAAVVYVPGRWPRVHIG
jgi:hypothetical protein